MNKSMKIKVSKRMVEEIKKGLKERNLNYNVDLIKVKEEEYYRNICIWYNVKDYTIDKDFNPEDNTFKVIKIEYPASYYACAAYLSSSDLLQIAKDNDYIYLDFINELVGSIVI